MRMFPDIGYPQTGEIASARTYVCMNCPHDSKDDKAIIILQEKEKLPNCPACKKPTYWMPI